MNLSEIRRDVILFKDETLKAMREMSKQLFEGIKQKSNELDSKITELESKLSKYKDSNKRMFDIILEQKVFIEKIKNFSEYKSKTETRLLEFDIKLSNFFSELVNFKSHYDKIITQNLNIPGIIGVSCKYNTIADYIADNINKVKFLHGEQDKMKNEIFLLKKNDDNLQKSLNGVIDVSVSTTKLYVDARNKEITITLNKKMEHLNSLLSETKNNLEENVYNKDDVKNLVKNELKISKKEIINIIEGNLKKKVILDKIDKTDKTDKDRDNKDKIDKNKSDKLVNSLEIKKELKEIRKNFNDLKTSMENKLMNTIKLIKNQESFNSSRNINHNYSKLKRNTMNPHKKSSINSINDNDSEKQENATIKSHNNIESYFKTLQNNETKYFNNKSNNNNINKENNEENNNINNKQNNNIEEETIGTVNSLSYKNENKSSLQYKIKTPDKTLNLKSSKLNSKLKGVLLNPINLETNIQENKIDNNPIMNNINIYNSPNKENIKHRPNYSRNETKYKTFSENKYNFAQKFLKENNKNLIKSESKKRNTKIYLSTKEIEKEKKFVINSIKSVNIKNINEGINNVINLENEADNTFSKDGQSIFRNNMQMDNSDKDKNNIAIKLMKNKKQVIDEFNLNYIKQYYPTLNLYKNYYNKKLLENKEKELKEKIKIPKKIEPAFGRTAYTEFVKPNSKINLKKYNGNVNIIVDNNLDNFMQEKEYFYTLNRNRESTRHKSLINYKNKKNQKIEEDINNLSV